MSRFNPEDFKVPTSDMTVNGKVVTWAVDKDDFITPHVNGHIRLIDNETKALYEEENGFWVQLKVIGGNVVSKVAEVRGPLSKKITDTHGSKGIVSEVKADTKRYYRECCCSSCGAPIGFYSVTEKAYAEAKSKGRETNNFTEDELEGHYGISFKDIDGVIYDDSRECNSCRSYC